MFDVMCIVLFHRTYKWANYDYRAQRTDEQNLMERKVKKKDNDNEQHQQKIKMKHNKCAD